MHSKTLSLIVLIYAGGLCVAQQIWDIWQTTWDRSKLFTSLGLSSPINFANPGPIGDADIVIKDGTKYQSIAGFGASLTFEQSEGMHFSNFARDTVHLVYQSKNSGNYNKLLNYLFNPGYGENAAGLNFIRIPIGASDFSASQYSLDDTSGDTSFNNFNINKIPSNVFSVLRDIKSYNSNLKLQLVPWSPPGWMKDSGTMNGGAFKTQYVTQYATYLLKAVQGFQNQGFSVYAISVQNEPQNSNPTYPTCTMSSDTEGRIATALRSLLNSNGLSGVKIIGYEHNWDNAGSYPIQLMNNYGDAFAGVGFHCYAGSVANQDTFHNAHPSKAIFFTECSGTFGSDWWSDLKWYMDNLWIGSLEHYSQSGLMWNLALDGSGNPKYPGTNSCGGPGCRALVTINSDGSYSLNQEFYSMAQASKAIIPKDPGGPFGQRIGVSVGGSLGWALRVGAYVTQRTSSAEWLQYSIVVLNWYDNASSGWNPKPVTTTIEFRGMQAKYTFPVGITTLWWFAPATGAVDISANPELRFKNGTMTGMGRNATDTGIKVEG
ncbi:hypothetical protein CVT24_001345 [Panaeolus cyanescens]|uniref:Glycosyl hydrolase family 30 TIM-barrel domain-containing protein n=1 Tax=Panaeolus cyanescens TaxID=181874 RepID=A0A409YFU9_9AGAR|nr:hypothetical protein CVT24_001345 [Panaeolus cyanescens]